MDGVKVQAGVQYAEVAMAKGERAFELSFDMTPKIVPFSLRPIAGELQADGEKADTHRHAHTHTHARAHTGHMLPHMLH